MSDLILVTGGAGTLGRSVAPVLLEAGYAVRLLDVRAIEDAPTGAETLIGDVRDPADVRSAMAGVTGEIHAAAWHGIHLGDHARDEFWDLNVRGTYHVYEAAAAAGVRAVVLSSTMAVYGDSRRPADGGPAKWIGEDLPRRPSEIYGVSKVISEDLPKRTPGWPASPELPCVRACSSRSHSITQGSGSCMAAWTSGTWPGRTLWSCSACFETAATSEHSTCSRNCHSGPTMDSRSAKTRSSSSGGTGPTPRGSSRRPVSRPGARSTRSMRSAGRRRTSVSDRSGALRSTSKLCGAGETAWCDERHAPGHWPAERSRPSAPSSPMSCSARRSELCPRKSRRPGLVRPAAQPQGQGRGARGPRLISHRSTTTMNFIRRILAIVRVRSARPEILVRRHRWRGYASLLVGVPESVLRVRPGLRISVGRFSMRRRATVGHGGRNGTSAAL